jgi:hypothetical protein
MQDITGGVRLCLESQITARQLCQDLHYSTMLNCQSCRASCMPKRKLPFWFSQELEDKIQYFCSVLHASSSPNILSVATEHKVPYDTLHQCYLGKNQPYFKAHIKQQLLSPKLETVLVDCSAPWGIHLAGAHFEARQLHCAMVLETMPEGQIRKEGLDLSSYAVPLTRVHAPHFRMKSRTHPMKFSWTPKVRQLWWKYPVDFRKSVGKSECDIWNCRNLSEIISKAWELNLDVCPKIERLLRTSLEVWKELKTTSGWIPSRNQQRKGYSGLCPMQKGTGWDVRDWTRGSVTKDVQRNTGWRMSIWT